ncbi:MAG: DUF1016 domain-containing protein [Bacteroidales bacterium]|nr:DUF1016 domain-containing protein [Bacteroidales bacterium]
MMIDNNYKEWLVDLKKRIKQSQIKAAIKVNTELLQLYWDLGHDIVVRQMDTVWGSGFFENLSKDLRREFPDMQGFSIANLRFIKRFYQFYAETVNHPQFEAYLPKQIYSHRTDGKFKLAEKQDITIRQQLVSEFSKSPISKISWGHHILIFTKCKSVTEALFYVQKTIENGWSRAVLMNFIEADLYSAQGKSLNNFDDILPAIQSDLAKEIIKDPYNFDFITLTALYNERDLEKALIDNITTFLLELGKGFAYIGRQVQIKIGKKDRFIDLLFYHLKLRCHVVIELKAVEFEVEHAAKLGLYMLAINDQWKHETDNPTIGILICKTKDEVEVKYALENSTQPIGVSEYELSKIIPENYKSALPSIEEIENELK